MSGHGLPNPPSPASGGRCDSPPASRRRDLPASGTGTGSIDELFGMLGEQVGLGGRG